MLVFSESPEAVAVCQISRSNQPWLVPLGAILRILAPHGKRPLDLLSARKSRPPRVITVCTRIGRVLKKD